MYSPCREDRANAAISWMVRALLDFGNISMVSSTFTWKDEKRKKKSVTQGKTGGAAHLSMNVSQAALTHRKTRVVFSWSRDSVFTQCNYFIVLQGSGKRRIFSLHTVQCFKWVTSCMKTNAHVHVRAAAHVHIHMLIYFSSRTTFMVKSCKLSMLRSVWRVKGATVWEIQFLAFLPWVRWKQLRSHVTHWRVLSCLFDPLKKANVGKRSSDFLESCCHREVTRQPALTTTTSDTKKKRTFPLKSHIVMT